MVELLRKTSQVEPTQSATLRPEGGVWRVDFKGTAAHVPDRKGLWHLRELVSRPHEFVSALALIGASSEEPIPSGDTGPLLDREALTKYRQRLAELDDDLDDAAVHGDARRAGEAKRRSGGSIAELKRATGLGGRPRRSGSPAEKARLNVTRTIRHAIADLSTTVPELAEHLDESIVTGVSCCYEPLTNIVWKRDLTAWFVQNEPGGSGERTPLLWVADGYPRRTDGIPMFVTVIHRIHDPEGFQAAEAKALEAGLPSYVALPIHGATNDHGLGICIWEGESVDAVREVVEGAVGPWAKNEYYEMQVDGLTPQLAR